MTTWYKEWFGEDYLRLYPHRDHVDAESAVALIEKNVQLRDKRVLDLACGPGRHAAPFAKRGAGVTGLDLSDTLLRVAASEVPELDLVRGDMRFLPFADESFDVVVNLFTSFGYFDDDECHDEVLREVARIVKGAGVFVIDYLNAGHVMATIVSNERIQVDGDHVRITRQITSDKKFVVKEMQQETDGRTFIERVRLFSVEQLHKMLHSAGFVINQQFGDYAGGSLEDMSPRVILITSRP